MNELLAGLNDKQKEAVLHFEGPLLIFSGCRLRKNPCSHPSIAYLIEEHQVPPYHILALTFTNKAAKRNARACE